MAVACTVYEWSRANREPATLPRKTPTEVERYANDIEADADCSLVGITIATSLWAIHPDDDDGTLTLSGDAVQGLITSVLVTGGTDGALYRLVNTVTLSDSRVLIFTTSLPVCETTSLAA